MTQALKLVIVGGVAGGASAAARARRLDENASIVLLERGPDISFANCGLPYHISGVIADRKRLLVQTAESMQRRFRIDVRTRTEATAINRARKTVRIRNLATGAETEEPYDKLIVSPGAVPVRPQLPGVDLPGIFTLRSLEDMDRIQDWIRIRGPKRCLIAGGGFIGLEMAEAFHGRGLTVTLVEMAPQVMGNLDPEMAAPVHRQLQDQGVALKLGVAVNGFRQVRNMLEAKLSSGESVTADMALLAIGVRPEIKLARDAGLDIGGRHGIRVNEYLQTSDPDIYAVGDAVETVDLIAGFPSPVPLAGPASRQGRLAADHAVGGRSTPYRGSQGTAICKIFGLTAASTGVSEKILKRLQRPYHKIYIHPASHAGYYPGAHPLRLKLLYAPEDGALLGAQVIGADGADKRIDVLATALRGRMTAFDLEHLELSYAPPYGSAKDPVNYAGFVAANALRGDVVFCHTEDVLAAGEAQILLDVRTRREAGAGAIPGSINIPIDELRARLGELHKNKEVLIYCQVGVRSYLAARILQAYGRRTRVLSGGYTTYQDVTGAASGKSSLSPKLEILQDSNESRDPAPEL